MINERGIEDEYSHYSNLKYDIFRILYHIFSAEDEYILKGADCHRQFRHPFYEFFLSVINKIVYQC